MRKQDKKAFFYLSAAFLCVVALIAWAATGHWWGVLIWAGYVMLWLSPLGPGLADLMDESEREDLREKVRNQQARIAELEASKNQ